MLSSSQCVSGSNLCHNLYLYVMLSSLLFCVLSVLSGVKVFLVTRSTLIVFVCNNTNNSAVMTVCYNTVVMRSRVNIGLLMCRRGLCCKMSAEFDFFIRSRKRY